MPRITLFSHRPSHVSGNQFLLSTRPLFQSLTRTDDPQKNTLTDGRWIIRATTPPPSSSLSHRIFLLVVLKAFY